jgi:hypothetical protein
MGKTTTESPIDVDIDIDGWVNNARNWISYERYFFSHFNTIWKQYLNDISSFFIEEGVDK